MLWLSETVVFQLETNEEVNRTDQKQRIMMQSSDKVLKSLSPLINSMKPFGLYFTRPPCTYLHKLYKFIKLQPRCVY